MSKQPADKYQVLLKGGAHQEQNDSLENWLNFLTDPSNLQPALPALTVECFSPKHGWGYLKVFVSFDETTASLKSLRVQVKVPFESGIKVFIENDSALTQHTATESNQASSKPDKLREWIFNLFMNIKLEFLDVGFLNTELPDLFDYLPNLKTLRINGARLLQMPPSFYRLSELVTFDMAYSSIAEVPFKLGRMPSLQSLTFSQPCSPAVLGSLRWLTSLTCHCNTFNVPQEITQLTHLRILSLSDIGTALDDFLDFPALQYLYFHSSENSVPFKFNKANVPGLKELNTNCIAAFANVISELQSLEILIAGGKALNEHDRNTLCGSLPQAKPLTHLSLSGLEITNIEFCLSLPRLKWLDLNNNAIVHIPAHMANLRDLRLLDLSNNSITHAPAELNNLYQNGRLFLQNNPIIRFPDWEVRKKAKHEVLRKGGVHQISINRNESLMDWLNFITDPSNLTPELPDLTLQIIPDNVSMEVSFDKHKASLCSFKLTWSEYYQKIFDIFQDHEQHHKTNTLVNEKSSSQIRYRSWVFNLFKHSELTELRIPCWNTELPNEFATLSKLRHIDFSHSNITSLPTSVCQLTALEILMLNDSLLSELPENVERLANLVTINLSRTSLTKLPEGLFSLHKLGSLYLEDTPINELPDRFGNLPKLKVLSLCLSGDTQLPASFFQLHALEILRLNSTSITELADRFDTLPCLKNVSITANISTLPASFYQLPTLEELNLESAGISELTDSFEKWINVKKISLKGTKITHLPSGFFKLPALEWLDLSESCLSEIPSELGNLPALRSLTFSQPCPALQWSDLAELTDLSCACPEFNIPSEFSQLVKLKNLQLKSVAYAAYDSMNLPELLTLEFKRSKNYKPFSLEAVLPRLQHLKTDYIEAFYASIRSGKVHKPLRITTG